MTYIINDNDILHDQKYFIISEKYRTNNHELIILTVIFMHLYVIWAICNVASLYKYRNMYPIRGRAPLLTIYQASNFLLILYLPFLAEILWIAGITKTSSPNYFHP